MRTFVFTCLLLLGMTTFAQDANFHIYLCLGQSNMEGNAKVEEQDTVAVDSRFQVLAAVDCPNLGRTKGNWYKAVPPLARCYTGLTPGDYFGRAMVANLPSNVRVGIINVAVGGCRIELFDKGNYQSYVETSPDWLKNMVLRGRLIGERHVYTTGRIAVVKLLTVLPIRVSKMLS